jgi:beta-lactam-binding protein with PASTA domain
MEQRALLPRWLPRAAVAVGIAVGLLLTYLHLWGVVPEVTSLAQVAAVSRLQKAGFLPGRSQRQAQASPSGP